MGGGSGAGGLSGLLGSGGQSFDPTTGSPIGAPPFSDWGGAYSGDPTSPAVTQAVPQLAAQNIQNQSFDPTTGSPTGSQSGPSAPQWVQNLSNMFFGGQGSPAAQAGLTGGRGGATPAPQAPANVGWPTAQSQAPGAAGAATPPSPVQSGTTAGLPEGTPGQTALNLPQSAPVSGKTQAVSAPAAAAPAPDTTNYPDVAGTSRESGAGPGGAGAYNNPAFSAPQGGGLPPVLQDLFTLNFGRFISDLLGQQGMPAGQNQAATPAPSDSATATTQDPNAAAAADTDTTKTAADTGQKAQTPAQKAAGALGAAGEALKPKPSPVESGPGAAVATPTPPAGPTVPTAPATPGRSYDPTTGQPIAAPWQAPAGTPMGPAWSMGPRAPEREPSYDPTTGQATGAARGSPFSMGPAAGTTPASAPTPSAAAPAGATPGAGIPGTAGASLPPPTTGGLPGGRAADEGRAIEPPAQPGTAPAQNWWGTKPPDYFQRHGGQVGQNLTTINTPFGRVTANRQVANDLQGLTQDWQQAGVPGISKLGGYNDRGKRYGAGKSSHSYGAAFDINDQAGKMNPQLQKWIDQHPQQWQTMLRNHNFAQYMPQGDPNHIEWVGPEGGTQAAARASVGLAGPAGAISSGRMTRGDRNRNPGNIKMGQDARQYGATGVDNQGHAIFPTVEAGIQAQASLLQRNYNNKTVAEIGRSYAEDPGWAAGVMQAGGFSPNERLNLNDPNTMRRLQEAIWRQEGTHPQGTHPNVGNAVGIPSRQGIDPRFGRAGVVSG